MHVLRGTKRGGTILQGARNNNFRKCVKTAACKRAAIAANKARNVRIKTITLSTSSACDLHLMHKTTSANATPEDKNGSLR